MEKYTVIDPSFNDEMLIPETTDPAHADLINSGPKQIFENTLCNRVEINLLKASTGDSTDMAYIEGASYALGDYCIYKNALYRCISAINQAEAWNAQHWEKTNITKELVMLQNKEVEVVDPLTATMAGFAADAQKTGKAIKDVSANLGSISTALAAVWKTIYPVGSIYISASSTSPATLFGGTWQQIQGRFLLAAGGGYAAGATGGEAAHTLTVSEIPSHNHYFSTGSGSGSSYMLAIEKPWGTTNQVNVSSTGGGAAHNNMPPYLVVYMWRRTA